MKFFSGKRHRLSFHMILFLVRAQSSADTLTMFWNALTSNTPCKEYHMASFLDTLMKSWEMRAFSWRDKSRGLRQPEVQPCQCSVAYFWAVDFAHNQALKHTSPTMFSSDMWNTVEKAWITSHQISVLPLLSLEHFHYSTEIYQYILLLISPES